MPNLSDNTVTKLRASDGGLVGTYNAGTTYPFDILFDGAYIRISGDATVAKLKASDGSLVGTYSAGPVAAGALAYDGTNIWAVSQYDSTVTKIHAP